MIKSFADKETRRVWNRRYSKKLPDDIQRRALKKLMSLDAATKVVDLRTPPGNRLERRSLHESKSCTATVKGSGLFASTGSGASASTSATATPTTWKLLTITKTPEYNG